MKSLHVANKLASAVDKYHSKKSNPAFEAPEGPAHGAKDPLEAHDQVRADEHEDPHSISEIESDLCPGCHTKIRQHLISKMSKPE